MDFPSECLCIRLKRHRSTKASNTDISLAPLLHGESLCLVATKGIFKLHREGHSSVLEEGMVLYLSAFNSLSISRAQTRASEIREIRFQGDIARDYVAFLEETYKNGIHSFNKETLKRYLRRLVNSLKRSEETNARESFRWFSLNHKAARDRQSNLGAFLQSFGQDFLETALSRQFQLAALARSFGCSPSHLAQSLYRTHGRTAGELLTECRWYHAWHLLKDTNLRIQEIATQCGYSSPSAFNAAYKKRFGMQPGKTRGQQEVPPTFNAPRLPSLPSSIPHTSCLPIVAEQQAAVVPPGPYFHFDGGITDIPYNKPYKLALNTISDSMQWVCTLEGEAIFQVGTNQIHVKPGMVILFPQPINAEWRSPTPQRWKRIWLKIRGTYALQSMAEYVQAHGWVVSIPTNSQPVRHAKRWLQHWQHNRGTFSHTASVAAFDWFIQWGELLKSGNITTNLSPDIDLFRTRSFFRRIKSITEYASQVGYSRSYLSQKLKTQWRETPHPAAFVRRHKLLQAAQDLRESTLSIETIARKAYYAHTSSFIAAFKREFSQTPLQYRRNHLRQNISPA